MEGIGKMSVKRGREGRRYKCEEVATTEKVQT